MLVNKDTSSQLLRKTKTWNALVDDRAANSGYKEKNERHEEEKSANVEYVARCHRCT
jgi:hypothetical protein